MTDQELFDKVKRDEECWHELTVNYDGILNCPYYECVKCHKTFGVPNPNPDFTTWSDFGWLWERMQEHKKWYSVLSYLWNQARFNSLYNGQMIIPTKYIHPTRFRNALKEFFA